MSSNMRTKPALLCSAIAAVMIVAGARAILLPPETGQDLSRLLGSLMLLAAAADQPYTWPPRESGREWSKGFLIALGSPLIIAGGYLLLYPQTSFALLTWVLLIYLAGDSILQFWKAYKLRHWLEAGWLRFEGTSNGIMFGIVVLAVWTTWPATSVPATGVLIGISTLFTGLTRLMFSVAPRRRVNYEEYHEVQ